MKNTDPDTAEMLPPKAGSPASLPSIDLESLFERCQGDVEMLLVFSRVFQQQAVGDMAAIDKALHAGDADGLRRAAHKLRGGAAYLSAEMVRRAAEHLESIAAAGELRRATEAVMGLGAALAPCLEQIHVIREQAANVTRGDEGRDRFGPPEAPEALLVGVPRRGRVHEH
jgi:HPt (histidine-containing phosphotransfer) domain-containing protein